MPGIPIVPIDIGDIGENGEPKPLTPLMGDILFMFGKPLPMLIGDLVDEKGLLEKPFPKFILGNDPDRFPEKGDENEENPERLKEFCG